MHILILGMKDKNPHKKVINMEIREGTTAEELKAMIYRGSPNDITLKYMKGGRVNGKIEKTKLFAVVKDLNDLIQVIDVYVDSSSDEGSSSDEDMNPISDMSGHSSLRM